MKDEQKTAQAKRLEEIIVFLKITTRELSHLAGVHENTLYKICCGHSSISSRTAARICYNIEKQYGISINRQWLIDGNGSMLDTEPSAPTPYQNVAHEHPLTMAAEDKTDLVSPDYKQKYLNLVEDYLELQKKYTALIEQMA